MEVLNKIVSTWFVTPTKIILQVFRDLCESVIFLQVQNESSSWFDQDVGDFVIIVLGFMEFQLGVGFEVWDEKGVEIDDIFFGVSKGVDDDLKSIMSQEE